ncbi:MAG TPA: hypothetical protein DIW77_01885 [Chromatiaceae bacterium]|jgi:hypothetical protein|nr:MAG: hypothetical protein N838_00485 [Thiohalocapsa sp. PB-PSB1]HCS88828.1 hypothetical protein [Chromatiaceae bacterium]
MLVSARWQSRRPITSLLPQPFGRYHDRSSRAGRGRATQAVSTLQGIGTAKLLEANQAATELLLEGSVVG